MLTNEKKISASALESALDCLDQLTNAAAQVAAIFHTYQVIVETTGLPVSSQSIEECSQMFSTMNLMMLREKADLQHKGMMQASMAKSDRLTKKLRQKKAESQEPVLFQQTA